MKKDESITYYFVRVMIISNKMGTNGENMLDKKIVEKIMRTLIKKFTYVAVSIEESKDIDNMSIDELKSSLVVHEQKFRKFCINGEEQVLKVEGRTKISNRERGTYRGRERRRGKLTFNKATVECYRCHDLGHFQYECPNMNKELNYAELEEDEMLLIAHMERHEAKKSDTWFLDSGCSNHMCARYVFNLRQDIFPHCQAWK